MKPFLLRIFLFFLLFITGVIIVTFTLPANPESYNQAYVLKERLLETTSSPRIILVGGSNVAFGFDSKMLEDSMGMKVVNTGLHAGIGLKFMIDDLFGYVKAGDIILLCPEYNQFFGKLPYGSLPLTEVITCIAPSKMTQLNFRQYMAILSNLPGNLKARCQYNFNSLFHRTGWIKEALYSIHSFNPHGDVYKHWQLPRAAYTQFKHIDDNFNIAFADYFIKQIKALQARSCKVFLCPAVISSTSYRNIQDNIEQVNLFCEKQEVPFIMPVQRYVFADSLCFDTPYHLTRKGTLLRMQFMIDDLRKHLNGSGE